MNPPLPSFFFRVPVVLAAACLLSVTTVAQTWTFRNGFGQAGATNGLADVGRAICTDASGNVYITGKISDDLTGNTVSFGGTALVSAGDDDGFVAKFNAAGAHQWSIRFGGTSFPDIGYGIATDGTSVYVAGTANGTITVGTSATTYPGAGTGVDGVIMKLDAGTGTVNWVTRFGGNSTDEAQAISLDGSGNVYVSGVFRTRTANATATFGAFTRTVQGNTTGYTSDLFVAKLNSSGVFQWVSTGGISGSNDNIEGSGICYVPSSSQVVVTGSFRSAVSGSLTATYATTAPVSSVTLTNSGNTIINEDFCLLEVDALNGAFVAGSSAGAADGNEKGLGITYDSYTGDVFFTGSFSGTSVTFPGVTAISNGSAGDDNAFYGRYNPSGNTYTWVKDADNSVSASAADKGLAITSNSAGGIIITGYFRNTITFPPGKSVTASGTLSDIFVARIAAATGEADYATQSTGTSTTVGDNGYGIACSTNGNVWLTGQYGTAITFAPLAALSSAGNREDILLAQFIDAPTITSSPVAVSACAGLQATFSVTATGTGTLSYSWQTATNSTFTTGLTTLTNTGVYSGANTNTLSISDITGLNGQYYRVIVSNTGGSITSSGALLTVQTPSLSTGHTVTQAVNTNSNVYYAAGCALINKVAPSGASPVSGSVTSQVWVEASVPSVGPNPFVQRHYQIVPAANAATATATITLYFTQTEFNNFNAAPGSILKLPANASDAVGKSNLRIGKYPGSSSDGSGMPGSYGTPETVIDPSDANIVYNTTFNRWEVTFDVTGFSGMIVQTQTTTLPVELISFSAQLARNDVQLQWKTASETAHDRFEVERSLDGKNFFAVGQRAGANHNTASDYQFTDGGAGLQNARKLYYRLKMVSTEGVATYSRVLIISLDKKGVFVTAVLPNPFVDELNIGVNATKNGEMHIAVFDIVGRRLVNRRIAVAKGFSTKTINDLATLSKGVYTLVVDFNGDVSTYKIIK